MAKPLFALLTACGLLAAADPAPSEFVLPDPLVSVQIHDGQRSAERCAAGPYGKLWARPEAAEIRALWQGLRDQAVADQQPWPAVLDAATTLRRGMFCFAPSGGRPLARTAVEFGDAVAFWDALIALDKTGNFAGGPPPAGVDEVLLEQRHKQAGLIRIGQVLVGMGADEAVTAEAIAARAAAPFAARVPEADLELDVDIGGYFGFLTEMTERMRRDFGHGDPAEQDLFAEFATLTENMHLTMDLQLSEQGIAERWQVTGGDPRVWAIMAKAKPFDRALLDSLPSNTLWAIGIQQDAALNQEFNTLFTSGAVNAGNAQLDNMMQEVGLPPLREVQEALNGPMLLYATQNAPGSLPSLTVSVSVSEAMATKLVDVLAAQVPQLKRNAAGRLQGLLGIVPLEIGVVEGGLVASTDMRGIAAHQEREPGFTRHPELAPALARLHADAHMVGLSRSRASWQSLVDLSTALLAFAGMAGQVGEFPGKALIPVVPELASWGMLSLSPTGEMRASGMITPLSAYPALAATFGYVMYQRVIRQVEQRKQAF